MTCVARGEIVKRTNDRDQPTNETNAFEYSETKIKLESRESNLFCDANIKIWSADSTQRTHNSTQH